MVNSRLYQSRSLNLDLVYQVQWKQSDCFFMEIYAGFNSLATIVRNWELWRLQDEARALKLREQKRLRDEAGMRAGGAYKRPLTS
jgi:hypothetical protein